MQALRVILEGARAGCGDGRERQPGASLAGGGGGSAKNDCNASRSLLLHHSFPSAGSLLSGSCNGFPNRFLGSFGLESSSRGFANNSPEKRMSSNAFVIRN